MSKNRELPHRFFILQRSLLLVPLGFLLLGLVLLIQQQSITQGYAAGTNEFHYASIDTMKESMDTDGYTQLSDAQIAQTVKTAAQVQVTHITVDTHWDYPAYAQRWVNAIQSAGKHVWFRMHPNAWEGDNKVSATMTPTQYLVAEKKFVQDHLSLFHSGDIVDLNPEPENAPYWKNTYGTGWTSKKAATDEYNNFYIRVSDTVAEVLAQAKIPGVITTIRSTNSGFNESPSILYPATVAHMGRVTLDSYPDQDTTDVHTAVSSRVNELEAIEKVRNVPIVIGEFGYSNHINVDDAKQQSVLKAELNALQSLSYIEGLNYWVGPGTENSGGYTHLFAGGTGDWSLRPAANDLAAFFKTMLAGTPTMTPIKQEAEDAALANGAKVSTTWSGYSGTGYVDGLWQTGASVTFTVNVPTTGKYTTTIYFANATGQSKTLSLYVNGVKSTQIYLLSMASWSTWGNHNEKLSLQKGSNTISYRYDSTDTGNVNLDYVTVASSL